MKLTKTSYLINSDGSAAAGLAGKRIAILADFHDRSHEPVLDMLRSDIPDAIMIPGDAILGYFPEGEGIIIERCQNVISLLEGCCTIAPTYMSIGNHECMLCDDDYDRLRSTGVTILDNAWTELKFRDDWSRERVPEGSSARVYVGGFTSALALSYRRFRDEYNRGKDIKDRRRYPYRRRPRELYRFPTESEWLDDFECLEGYKILLCHHPEYWCLREPMLADRKIDLVLAGHAHGGQWRLMGRGIFAPGQGLFPKYTSGVHQGRNGNLVISRGLSNPYDSVPRLGNPCEAVYVQFEKRQWKR